jgi:hypothetical protein
MTVEQLRHEGGEVMGIKLDDQGNVVQAATPSVSHATKDEE